LDFTDSQEAATTKTRDIQKFVIYLLLTHGMKIFIGSLYPLSGGRKLETKENGKEEIL